VPQERRLRKNEKERTEKAKERNGERKRKKE